MEVTVSKELRAEVLELISMYIEEPELVVTTITLSH